MRSANIAELRDRLTHDLREVRAGQLTDAECVRAVKLASAAAAVGFTVRT